MDFYIASSGLGGWEEEAYGGREKTPISGSAPVQQLLGQRSKEVRWGLSHLGLRMTWSGTVRKQAWTAAACELLAHCLLSVPS